jgi:hypothetical protein
MYLSEDEARFVAKRSRLVKAWRPLGVLLLIGVSALAGWLFWSVPLLANPFAVLDRLQADAIPAANMALATVMLPVVFLVCVLLAVAIVLLVFAAMSNERKYLTIVRRLAKEAAANRPR